MVIGGYCAAKMSRKAQIATKKAAQAAFLNND